MPGKTFLDANILVYAQDRASPAKRRRCREVIQTLALEGTGVISTQVMQEFYVASTRKLGIQPLAAKHILKTFGVFEIVPVSPSLIDEAVDLSIVGQLSFWDALIVAAAADAGCTELFTEDLNPGQIFRGVRIHNPLAPRH